MRFPHEVTDFNTTRLTASHNNLTSLRNNTFSAFRLQLLTDIILDYNSISEVDSNTFKGLVNLRFLSISHNVIVNLHPETFADTVKLQKIYISENSLIYLYPELLMKNRDLHIFHAANNRIQILPLDLFKYNNNLTEVYVNGNELTYLNSEQFRHNPELKVLHLEDNNIVFLHADTFTYSRILLYVNFSNNEIHSLHSNIFQKNCYLKIVDLSNNKLDRISVCRQHCLNEVMKIDISGNPLICDSTLEEILESCRSYTIHIVGACGSGTPRNSTKVFRGKRSQRTASDIKNISETTNGSSSSPVMATHNYDDTSAKIQSVEETAVSPEEIKHTALNESNSVSSDNENVTVTFDDEYETSASSPEGSEQILTALASLVEYRSPLVLRESTVRGFLFIGIECSLAFIVVIRKFVCARNKSDSTVADAIELLSESEPSFERGNEREDDGEV